MSSADGFSYKRFYLSRFLRTVPVYFGVLVAYFLFVDFRERPTMAPLWRFLTFTQNFSPPGSAFSHAWSLCIEEQFYLVCPAIVLVLFRPKKAWVSVVALIALVLLGAIYRESAWNQLHAEMTSEKKWDLYLASIYYPIWGRVDGLALGVLVAVIQQFVPSMWSFAKRKRVGVLALALTSFACAVWLFSDRLSWRATVFGYPTLALSFAFLVTYAAADGRQLLWLRKLGVGQLAILSYSFYLVHKQVMHLIAESWRFDSTAPEQMTYALASFVASFALAFFMYQLIERPFLVLRTRLLGGTR